MTDHEYQQHLRYIALELKQFSPRVYAIKGRAWVESHEICGYFNLTHIELINKIVDIYNKKKHSKEFLDLQFYVKKYYGQEKPLIYYEISSKGFELLKFKMHLQRSKSYRSLFKIKSRCSTTTPNIPPPEESISIV